MGYWSLECDAEAGQESELRAVRDDLEQRVQTRLKGGSNGKGYPKGLQKGWDQSEEKARSDASETARARAKVRLFRDRVVRVGSGDSRSCVA